MPELKSITRNEINQEVVLTALLVDVKIKKTKNGKKYADLVVQDASMKREVKLWDADEEDPLMKKRDEPPVVELVALVGEYQGRLQLTIKK